MLVLTVTEKGGEPRELSFDKSEIYLGRTSTNDVALQKGNVSKRHCRIVLEAGQVTVEDVGSTNGTYVNGRKIDGPTIVTAADKIFVGDFLVRLAGEASAPGPHEIDTAPVAVAPARRGPPPPPPPGRATASMSTVEDGEVAGARSTGSGRIAVPPPLPPPRRASGAFAPPPPLEDDLEPPAPSDIDLDDDVIDAAPPKLDVPPLNAMLSLSDEEPGRDVPGLAGLTNDVPTVARSAPGPLPPAPETPKPQAPAPAAPWTAPVAPPAKPVPAVPAEPAALTVDGHDFLLKLLAAPGVDAVYVNGPQAIEVERGGKREPATVRGGLDATRLMDAAWSLAATGIPMPSPDARVVRVTLEDGARLAAIFPPVASETCVALYKGGGATRSLSDLVTEDVISKEMRQVLEGCTTTRRNLLVSGDPRAVDMVLQALASSIHSRDRVVMVGNRIKPPAATTPWIRLSTEPRSAVVVPAAAALRPDYLVVDVTSSPLAADVVQECTLGQEGVIAAIASRSAHDALRRLRVLAAPALGIEGLAELVASSFDVVVYAAVLGDGKVRVVELAEPRVEDGGRLRADALHSWKADASGTRGSFTISDVRSRLATTLASRGAALPSSVLPK